MLASYEIFHFSVNYGFVIFYSTDLSCESYNTYFFVTFTEVNKLYFVQGKFSLANLVFVGKARSLQSFKMFLSLGAVL